MNAYFMIQRKMQYILTDANDNILVQDLKCIIESIIKVPPENQQLYYQNKILDETKTLSACGLSCYFANVHHPVTIGLALKMDNGEFEKLDLTPYPMRSEITFKRKITPPCTEPSGKLNSDPSVSNDPRGESSGSGKPRGKLNSSGKPRSKPSGKEKSKGKPKNNTSV